ANKTPSDQPPNDGGAVVMTKFDAPLKQKLAEVEASDAAAQLRFLGKCAQPIDDTMREALSKAGVTVNSVTGDIFTASGTAAQIKSAAQLDFVTQLQLSVERKLY
ncbi:MAG: hypothetical protein KDI38_26650, partial [Calditrichaeota bacterium]|nr:hypothetical protein [Calditrichota bacterium]